MAHQQQHQQRHQDDANPFGDGFLYFVQPRQQQQQQPSVAPVAPAPKMAAAATDPHAEELRRQNEELQRQLQQQQEENKRLREAQQARERAQQQQLKQRPSTAGAAAAGVAGEPAPRSAVPPRHRRPNAREVVGSLDFDEPQPQVQPFHGHAFVRRQRNLLASVTCVAWFSILCWSWS